MKYLFVLLFIVTNYCNGQNCNSPGQPDTAWVYTYGGTNDDYARQIISTHDSGYIIAGSTSSFGIGTSDIYIIKTDSNAVKQWSKVYGTQDIEWGYSIRETFDHGFVFCGFTNHNPNQDYNVYLVKIDSAGNLQWTKNIGGPDWDFGAALELTPDGGFIICGSTWSYSNGGSDVYILKTDSAGNVVWQKNYGGLENDSANAIIRERDNNYVIVGSTRSFGAGDDDFYVLKINGNGDTIWTKTFGTPYFDAGYGIDTALDGNYLLIGTSWPGDTTAHQYFFKLDTSGNTVLWSQLESGNIPEDREGYFIKQLPTGDIIIGGTQNPGGWGGKAFEMSLRKPSGDWDRWGASFGCTHDEEGYSVAVGKDNQVIFAGITNSIGCGFNDVYLIRIDTFAGDYWNQIDSTCDTPFSINTEAPSHLSNINNCFLYPNPAHDFINLDCDTSNKNDKNSFITISDVTGREIRKIQVSSSTSLISRNDLANGIYFVRLYLSSNEYYTGKLILY